MQTKCETLQFVGVMLMFLSIAGFMRQPVLGIFHMGLLQVVLLFIAGISCFYCLFLSGFRQRLLEKSLTLIFFVVAIVGFLFNGRTVLSLIVFQTASSWLSLFLSGVFAYITYGKAYQKTYTLA